MLKIYHNPRCKKSRLGLEYLKSKNLDFKIREYFRDNITKEEIKEIILKTNKKPVDLIRTQEKIYKSDFKNKTFTDDEWINIIIEYPNLLKRPIVVSKHKAVIADPAERIDEIA